MIDLLKNLQGALLQLLPHKLSELTFDGAGAVLIIVLVVVAGVTFASAASVVGKWLDKTLEKKSRAATIFIFGVAILASLGAKRPLTALVIVLLAASAAILNRWYELTPFAYFLLVLFFGGISVFAEGSFLEYQRRITDEQITVYVVLPFQPSGGADQAVVLNLSVVLRNTFRDIFGTLANVKVQPDGSLQPGDLEAWRKPEDVAARLSRLGLSPDITLQNEGTITSNPQPPAKYVTLLLSPRFHRNGSYGRSIVACGLDEQLEYLAIRASLELLAQIKAAAPESLTNETETAILQNAIRKYVLQLQRELQCPTGPRCGPATALAHDPAITLAKAVAVANAYPPDASPRVQEINDVRARSNIAKVDWLSLPQPPEPAPPPPPAPAAPEAGS